MIRFNPPLIYEGSTVFAAEAPEGLRALLIHGLNKEYAKGSWGHYLHQELVLPDCSCEITHFNMKKDEGLFPTPSAAMFSLHHLFKAELYAEINDGMPVYLGEDRSYFFYLPLDIRQTAYLKKGITISIHINYTLEFLQQNLQLFPFLSKFIQQYQRDPRNAIFEGPVQHNYITRHAWKKFYSELRAHNNPARLVAVMARELLVTFCDALEKTTGEREKLRDVSRGKLSHLTEIHKVKEIIENDVTKRHRYKELAAAVGLNEQYMKSGFRAVYNLPIHQFVVRCKMEFAHNEILLTREPVKNIARACGYENVSHFIAMFKKWFRQTPDELRGR